MSNAIEQVPEVAPDVLGDLLKAVDFHAHDPDHLPLFQHCLFWLWIAFAKAPGGGGERALPARLTSEHLRKVAGPKNAQRSGDRVANILTDCLDYQADVAFNKLSADDQVRARRLLSILGIKDEQQRCKRTPLRFSRLEEIGLSHEDYRRIQEQINNPHPYIRETANDEIDILHETLLRKWKRLRDWLHEDYERACLYRKVCESYAAWVAGGCPKDAELLYRKFADEAVEARLFAADEKRGDARWRKRSGIPLTLERLYPWDADPLGIRDRPARLETEHDGMREYVNASIAFHRKHEAKDRRRSWIMRVSCTAALAIAAVGMAFWYETDLLERESRAFQSFAIAANSFQDRNESSAERRLVALWKGVTAKSLFEQSPGRWAMLDGMPVEQGRKARLANARALGEGRLTALYQQALDVPITQDRKSSAIVKLAPVADAPNAQQRECVAGGRTVLKVTPENLVAGRDGRLLGSFHPKSKVALSPGCEVIVTAVPIRESDDNVRKLELTFVSWRKVDGTWEATATDYKGPIAMLEDVVDVARAWLDDEFTVAIEYSTPRSRLEQVRVVSLRRDPWPAAIPDEHAKDMARPETGTSPHCNYLSKEFSDPKIESKSFRSYVRKGAIICAALLTHAKVSPGQFPQRVELFVIPRNGVIRDFHRVPVARIPFIGPQITDVRLGESGAMAGWMELSTGAGSAPMTYVVPAQLTALARVACRALYASPRDVRERLADAKTDWGLEYQLILKANRSLTDYHALVNDVASGSNDGAGRCAGREDAS